MRRVRLALDRQDAQARGHLIIEMVDHDYGINHDCRIYLGHSFRKRR